tara:strand:+ start:569 stop:1138 length:570 start_codon:yes stop_codon:yes gene_type:complete
MNTRPVILPNESYIDNDKITHLTKLIQQLVDTVDIKSFGVDVGMVNKGYNIGWYSTIVMPFEHEDTFYVKYPELHDAAQEVLAFAKTMNGIDRIAINTLAPVSLLPLHYDNESDEDDKIPIPHYNLLVPLTDGGHSIVNDRLYENYYGVPIIFDPQSHHGAINSSEEWRMNYFVKVKNEAFHEFNSNKF